MDAAARPPSGPSSPGLPALLFVIVGLACVCAWATDSTSQVSGPSARPSSDSARVFAPIPEFHVLGDVSKFTLHKKGYGGYFRRHYYLEGNIDLEVALFSIKRVFYWFWGVDVHPGMGHTPKNVVFDPMDINYNIQPVLEFRIPHVNLQAGIEHRCFHEIDRLDFYAIYFNKVFVAAGSKNMRLADYCRTLKDRAAWTQANRVQWYARWGYFVTDVGGLVNLVMVNDIADNVTNVQELSADVRYAIVNLQYVVLNAHGATLVGHTHVDGANGEVKQRTYWREDLSLEVMITAGKVGGFLYADYIRDGLPLIRARDGSMQPRLSKDGILQLGFGFFL